jgi:hypothetical protein
MSFRDISLDGHRNRKSEENQSKFTHLEIRTCQLSYFWFHSYCAYFEPYTTGGDKDTPTLPK